MEVFLYLIEDIFKVLESNINHFRFFILNHIATPFLVASMLSEALGSVEGDDGDDEDEEGLNGAGPAGSEEEEKQLQNMMFNLMVKYLALTYFMK